MIKIKIFFEPSDKIVELRNKVTKLEQQLSEEKRKYTSLEYSYVNECRCNFELTDILQANGIHFRPHLSHKERSKYGR